MLLEPDRGRLTAVAQTDRRRDRPGPVQGAVRIKDLIDQHRAEAITKLEGEVFVQRKRLADAERKLQTKPTKAAGQSRRIAGAKIEAALIRLSRPKATQAHPSDARILPMYYKARRDNLEKFWRHEFGYSHAVMLAESFYENVDRDGRNAALHFVPRPADTMLVACLFAQWTDPAGGEPLLSFAAVTDEPPPAHVAAWLTPAGRSLQELRDILSDRQAPYYEHEVLAA